MNKLCTLLGILGTMFYLSSLVDEEDLDFENHEDILADLESQVGLDSEEILSSEGEKIGEVQILAVGDMMLGRYVRVLMDLYGKDYVFEKLENDPKNKVEEEFADVNYESEISFLNQADLTFGNLEGPILGTGKKGGTSTNFAFHEDVVPWLKESGFDLVSIANNHAMDQGWEGRESTIKALDSANLSWCGHPTEADSESVFYKEIEGIKIAFICFEDAISRLNYKDAVSLISQTKSSVDYLIVSIHWGYEYQHTANLERQIEPAHQFVDAGADLILGHHPHVVQNFEIYKGNFIFYSLGNFVFDQYFSSDVQEELALMIEISEREENLYDLNDLENLESVVGFQTTVFLHPLKSENSQSRLMNEEEKTDWLGRFANYGEFDEETIKMIETGVLKN